MYTGNDRAGTQQDLYIYVCRCFEGGDALVGWWDGGVVCVYLHIFVDT
jgi:hypothetical protein